MDRSLGLLSAQTMRTTTAADAPPARPAEGAPAGRHQAADGNGGAAHSSSTSLFRATDNTAISTNSIPGTNSTSPASTGWSPRGPHDQMAQRMNDVVVRRIFSAGLDLEAALGLLGEDRPATDHRAASKICHASEELDHAIRDLRDILFEDVPQ